MHFLPYQRVTFITKISPAEVQKRLSDNLEPAGKIVWRLPFSRSGKPYRGEASLNGFKITRIISYRNSFLPVILGKVFTQLGKTQIALTLRMNHAVLAFMVIWYFLLLPTSLSLLSKSDRMGAAGPLGLCLFLYLLALVCFSLEAAKSRKFLLHLLEAQVQ